MRGDMRRFNESLNGVKMIEGDDKVRAEKCLQEINRALAVFDCNMVPEVIISAGQVMTRVSIVAKPRVPPPRPAQN